VVDGLTFGHHAHDTVAVVAAIGALYGGGEGSSLHECGRDIYGAKKGGNRCHLLLKTRNPEIEIRGSEYIIS
jgi:hypothetical protein